ncbi:MAG: PTS sugar transporter subunit IIB [Aerococcus sp.]|nr:PTS sugar transporter subunit IIB [Aerococcus sp.]
MKKLLVMCGSGIATSTVVSGKIRSWLQENGYGNQVEMHQGKVADELNKLDNYDVVISTTIVPDKYQDQVINGVGLLTGRDTDKIYQAVDEKLKG